MYKKSIQLLLLFFFFISLIIHVNLIIIHYIIWSLRYEANRSFIRPFHIFLFQQKLIWKLRINNCKVIISIAILTSIILKQMGNSIERWANNKTSFRCYSNLLLKNIYLHCYSSIRIVLINVLYPKLLWISWFNQINLPIQDFHIYVIIILFVIATIKISL